MGLVVLRHGQDRDHGNGTFLADLAPGALVHGGKVGIQVTGIPTAAGDFLFGGGNLPQRFGIVGDIGKNDQDVHPQIKSQVFRRCQRHTRGSDTLYRGVVCQIGEQHGTVDGAGAPEFVDKELGFFEGDADGGKHNGKVAFPIQHPGLTGDLRRQLGVRQTGAGKDGQLLPTDKGVQAINGGNAGLDKLVGIVAGGGIHGKAVDIPVFLRQNGRSVINGLAHAVEHTAQHIAGNRQLQRMAQKPDFGVGQIDTGRGFKQLYNGGIAVDLQHLAAPGGAIGQLDFRQLIVGDALHMVHYHQRSRNFADRFVFTDHCASSPFWARASNSSSISASSLSYCSR